MFRSRSSLSLFFFFSSRRRHTRFKCDWSSDVCSSDLWRYADTLEAITAESRPFFLDSTGDSAREMYAAGSLAPGRVARGAPDHYRYDPRDLSLARIESESDLGPALDDSALYQAVFLPHE